jgi:hypothetical protein
MRLLQFCIPRLDKTIFTAWGKAAAGESTINSLVPYPLDNYTDLQNKVR